MPEHVNVFVKNPVIPDYHIALVVERAAGPETIWMGHMRDATEDDFNRADEAHVNDWTYAYLAARLAATRKGTYVQ